MKLDFKYCRLIIVINCNSNFILDDFIDSIICEIMIVFLLFLFGYNIDLVIFEKYIMVERIWGRLLFDLFIGKLFLEFFKLLLNSLFKVRIDKFFLLLGLNNFVYGRIVGSEIVLFRENN